MSILKVIDSVHKKLLGKLHYILNGPRINQGMFTVMSKVRRMRLKSAVRQNITKYNIWNLLDRFVMYS